MRAFVGLILLVPLSTGCVSHWRGKEIEANMTAMQAQVDLLNEQSRAQVKRVEQMLESRLGDLERRLGEAIAQLQKGSADTGIDLEKLRDELKRVQGELAETREKLKASEQAAELGVAVAPVPGEALPETETDLYRVGYEKYKAQDWDGAIRVFSAYTNKFPGAAQADNALYLMAEALTQKQDFAASVRVLQAILQKYSSGDKVDDAYVLMHDNFVALKRCKDAIPFLETLIADFPSSSRIADAKKKLAATKRTCR
ncbi:MAG: outer membrane protein assembly factor BamD [Bradymonadia bacterium]|jgi:TolA-binding protein